MRSVTVAIRRDLSCFSRGLSSVRSVSVVVSGAARLSPAGRVNRSCCQVVLVAVVVVQSPFL